MCTQHTHSTLTPTTEQTKRLRSWLRARLATWKLHSVHANAESLSLQQTSATCSWLLSHKLILTPYPFTEQNNATALMAACTFGHVEAAQLLLDNGAGINIQTKVRA